MLVIGYLLERQCLSGVAGQVQANMGADILSGIYRVLSVQCQWRTIGGHASVVPSKGRPYFQNVVTFRLAGNIVGGGCASVN